MALIETERLYLEWMDVSGANFVYDLLRSDGWLKYIGDRGIHTLDDASAYIQTAFIDHYTLHGYGMYKMIRKDTGESVGTCGLIKRDWLEHVDIGYAILPDYYRQGYTTEAAKAVLDYGRSQLGIQVIWAITNEDNIGSIRVLDHVGFTFKDRIKYNGDGSEVLLYTT